MEMVKVTSKFRVVIPLKVRKMLGIQRGQKMQVIAYDNRVVLIPLRPIQAARGSLKGMDTNVQREDDENLYWSQS
jgi:AbrB family looped-hinge helix DNA binding protein